jgi:hypothetical protein
MQLRNLLSLAGLILLMARPAVAQTTFATITGTVTDPSGAVLPNASVEATRLENNYPYSARTNDAGLFTLSQLLEGTYMLRVTAQGFRASVVNDIQVLARDVRRIDVRMTVGEVSTRVEVTAGATLIETETARISQTRTAEELKDLPLNTRSVTSFLSLVPGVGQATTVTATYRFNGSRRNQSEFTIDGISNVTSNGTQTSPLTNYIESFQEVRIDSADNAADTGAVGQVTVVSKSGTNDLHGSAFDYYVTPLFRARDFFSPQRASGISHRPGGSISGPVYLPHLYNGRNKTFFFYSYETSRGSITQQLLNPTVPLAAWRNGDFSGLLPQTVIKDPTTGQPFQGNIIPQDHLNLVSLKIQDRFYPLPNFGNTAVLQSQNFREVLTHPFDPNTYWTVRIDHRFSDKTFLYGRYTWQRQYNSNFDANLPTIGRITDTRNTRNAVISWTQVLSGNLVNVLRYGYMFTNEPRWGPLDGQTIVDQLGLQGLVPNQPDLPGVPNISFTGVGLTTITQQQWRSPGFYNRNNVIQEQMSWTHGRHTIKSGAQIGDYRANDVTASTALYGQMSFSNRFTGFPYADFLLGIPTTSSRAPAPLDAPFKHRAYDFFATDEWKASSRLTLNLGMRYELHPHWGSGNGLASLFDVKTGQIVVEDGSLNKVSPLMPLNYVKVVTASQAGYSGSALISTDKKNLAPRVGVAWRPWDQKTVFRAGFGIYYDIVPTSISVAGVPFAVNEPSFTNPMSNPTVILPLVFPNSVAGPTTVSLPGAFKKDLCIPYTMQYNVTLERQIAKMGVRVSYVGTGTRQGQYVYNYNQPVASTTLYINKPRPFPNYPAINYTTNGASHQYNGFSVEAKRRLAGDLLYDFTWTWARDIGDLERDQTPENSYDLHRERAVWADIPTHRVTADFVYQLPFGGGKKWLGHASRWANVVAGGWTITGLTAMNTGPFLTPIWQGPDPTNTANTTSSTPPTVSIRPNILHDPNLAASLRSPSRWFDVSAFGPPTPGSFGTSAKGVIVGPGSFVIDAGVTKSFNFSERFQLRWELTGTNVLNHPNFDISPAAGALTSPALTITNLNTAGVVTSTGNNGAGGLDASGARSLRMGLRLEW